MRVCKREFRAVPTPRQRAESAYGDPQGIDARTINSIAPSGSSSLVAPSGQPVSAGTAICTVLKRAADPHNSWLSAGPDGGRRQNQLFCGAYACGLESLLPAQLVCTTR